MIKYPALCFLAFLFGANSLTSQELPEIIPPSPTAFQMTRYGDVPINESTGNISPSIPIYTYTAGRLQLPISLSFQGNGVKVDQAAGWTGINWNLSAGGVITRVVRDEDDLFLQGASRESFSYQDLHNYDTSDINSSSALNSFITSPNIDTEADIFSFTLPGHSGSFYLDAQLQPKLTRNDVPLKIQLLQNGYDPISETGDTIFLITTPDGVQYYFGGSAASEATKEQPINGGSGPNEYALTSFYLYRIVHPLGDEINLVYSNHGYHIDIAKSESYTKVYSKDEDCPDSAASLENLSYGDMALKSENGKTLYRISSNRNHHRILFNTSNPNSNVSRHYSKILNSIVVEQSNDGVAYGTFKKVDLSYYFPYNSNPSYPNNGSLNDATNAQRFFLKSVIFRGDSSNREYEYGMLYKDLEELPNRFSYGQDYLGYYNGVTDNVRSLPEVDHPAFATIYSTLADRSFDLEYASAGVLERLTYPTKGYSLFEYETSFTDDYNIENKNKRSNIYRNYNNQPPGGIVNKNPYTTIIPQLSLEPFEPAEGNGNGNQTFSTTDEELVNQTITVHIKDIISTELLHSGTKFCLTIYDQTEEQYLVSPCGKSASIVFSNNPSTHIDPYLGPVFNYPDLSIRYISLKAGHVYNIKIEIVPHGTNSSATIYAFVDFDYKVQTNELQEAGDIRIKKITDHSLEQGEGSTTVKRFFYSKEPALLPRHLSYSFVRACCPGVGTNDYRLATLSSNSLFNIFANGSNAKMYRQVSISYGGNNYEQGGVIKEFIREPDGLPVPFIFHNEDFPTSVTERRENKSAINGTPLKETILEKKNNKLFPVQETRNFYSTDRNTSYSNNICKTLYTSCTVDSHTSLQHLAIEYYATYSNKIRLDSTITKVFDYSKIVEIDPSTIDTDGDGLTDDVDPDDDNDGYPDWADNDDNGNGIDDEIEANQQPETMETRTAYAYNQYVGLPTNIVTSSSKSDVTYETVHQYTVSPSGGDQISDPLTTTSYKNEDGSPPMLLSHINKVYSSGLSSSGSRLLQKIRTKKHGPISSDLDERITYHRYDNVNNPVEVSKTDGTPISYIWGYNHSFPVAKLEGVTFAQVETLLGANFNAGSGALTPQQVTDLRAAFPNVMVSTYTYDPLVGVTSMTDARDYTVYYEYDEFHRLKQVKDAEGNILSKNEYKFATQN